MCLLIVAQTCTKKRVNLRGKIACIHAKSIHIYAHLHIHVYAHVHIHIQLCIHTVQAATILGAESREEGGKKFTVFKVELRSDIGPWVVHRRYHRLDVYV
jgi:hypothetical protein